MLIVVLIIVLIYIINNRTTNLYDNYNVIYSIVKRGYNY